MTRAERSVDHVEGDPGADFVVFFGEAEPRLRRALSAAYGAHDGREATADALAWAWEHWGELCSMTNPVGYLYRVGQSAVPRRRVGATDFERAGGSEPWIEPALRPALAGLSERQRVAVVLIHGYGWTYREVAELTGTTVTTVQNHLERGLRALRRKLGISDA